MPTCYLDDDPHDIVLAGTPISDRWLELFAGQSLQINRPYDATTIDNLYDLITTHRPLFSKLRLDFLTNISASTQLMHQRNLTDIHAGMVELQKKHRGITDILTKNTQGDWEAIHENIHILESKIRKDKMEFMRTPGLQHDTTDISPGWRWDDQFTKTQWADSTSFTTSHLSIPTTELGRTPYEAFQFAPDQWQSEGSLNGVLAPRIDLRATGCQHRPDHGYEQWCERQGLPIIGEHLPMANFTNDDFLESLPTVSTMRLER